MESNWDKRVSISTRPKTRKVDGAIFKMISGDFMENEIEMEQENAPFPNMVWRGTSQEFAEQFEI